jgi:hypothetical protein
MPTMQEVRTKFPQYNDMPDRELADALHSKFYADIPKPEYYKSIGFQDTTGAPATLATPQKPGFLGEVWNAARNRVGQLQQITDKGTSNNPLMTGARLAGGAAIAGGGFLNDVAGAGLSRLMDTGIVKDLTEPVRQTLSDWGRTDAGKYIAEKGKAFLTEYPQVAADAQTVMDASGSGSKGDGETCCTSRP